MKYKVDFLPHALPVDCENCRHFYPGCKECSKEYLINQIEQAGRKLLNHHCYTKEQKNRVLGFINGIEKEIGAYVPLDNNHGNVVNVSTGERFSSITTAAGAYGVTYQALRKHLDGKTKKCAGCEWRIE